jgi:hypothetical protein
MEIIATSFGILRTSWALLVAGLVRLLPVGLCILGAFILLAVFGTHEWPFALRADTRHIEVDLPDSHQSVWNLDGAVICTRTALDARQELLVSLTQDETVLLCGSSRWRAYAPAVQGSMPAEVTAVFGTDATADPGYVAARASLTGDRLQIDLRRLEGAAATLRLVASSGAPLPIADRVMLIWPSSDGSARVFPFAATVRVGQDVNFARTELLEGGQISVFSASDESIAGRALVQTFELTPGDRVELGSRVERDQARSYPRGFFRLDPRRAGDGAATGAGTLEVIAFGAAESVRVLRLGDTGFSFEPSLWMRLSYNNRVVIWSLVIFGVLSVLAGLAEARQLRRADDE